MNKHNYAVYKHNKIVSLHRSYDAAKRKAGKGGQVLDTLPDGYPPYSGKYGEKYQLFFAPAETGHHYVSLAGFCEPIY